VKPLIGKNGLRSIHSLDAAGVGDVAYCLRVPHVEALERHPKYFNI
jgi:hypothetical protein